MKRYIILLCLSFVLFSSYSQSKEYSLHSDKADILFKKKDFINAAQEYTLAFSSNNDLGKIIHRYRAASCWSLLNKPDSAFNQLDKIAFKGNFTMYDLIEKDVNLFSLHNDSRWKPIIEKIKSNESKILDLPVVN